jgi:hypothetical protein
VANVSHWSQALGAFFVGLVGLWIAHSYRRQVKVKLAERLADSYAALWELTRTASTGRPGPRTVESRAEMEELLENWYFDNGNGLLMSKPSRLLFFHIKGNLTAPASEMVPKSLSDRFPGLDPAEVDAVRACAHSRQISMLRTQLKDDLAIYRGRSHQRHRRKDERDLLTMCGIDCGSLPLRRSRTPTPCICGKCPGSYSWPGRISSIRRFARRDPAIEPARTDTPTTST